MLILTRKRGEAITVDGPAELHIKEIRGRRVIVAVHAPEETKILRAEIRTDEAERPDAPAA